MLLKNDRSTLPLDINNVLVSQKVAVVGRNADATHNMQGNYFGPAPYLVSPCDGIARAVVTDRQATLCNTGEDSGAAVIQAINAGTVVLVVGLTSEGDKRLATRTRPRVATAPTLPSPTGRPNSSQPCPRPPPARMCRWCWSP